MWWCSGGVSRVCGGAEVELVGCVVQWQSESL